MGGGANSLFVLVRAARAARAAWLFVCIRAARAATRASPERERAGTSPALSPPPTGLVIPMLRPTFIRTRRMGIVCVCFAKGKRNLIFV